MAFEWFVVGASIRLITILFLRYAETVIALDWQMERTFLRRTVRWVNSARAVFAENFSDRASVYGLAISDVFGAAHIGAFHWGLLITGRETCAKHSQAGASTIRAENRSSV